MTTTLILTPIISPQSGWQWTWSNLKLHMGGSSDGGWQFWNLGGVTRWNSQFLIHTSTFLAITLCCFTVAPLFVLEMSTAWNRCLQHPCFQNLRKIAWASKNSDSNAPHFPFRFHSMLFALRCYQFPYTVMNRCLYLMPQNLLNHCFKGGVSSPTGACGNPAKRGSPLQRHLWSHTSLSPRLRGFVKMVLTKGLVSRPPACLLLAASEVR